MRSSRCSFLLVALTALGIGGSGCSVDEAGIAQPGSTGTMPAGSAGGQSTGGSPVRPVGSGGARGDDGGGAGVIGTGGADGSSTGGASDDGTTGSGGAGAVGAASGGNVGSGGGGNAGGRGGGGGLTTLGGRGGNAGAGGAGGALATIAGCADGTREAFTSLTRFPSIAACAGGWTVPGVLTPASTLPTCGRAAGNNGTNPNGVGCTVADLCADGWHVCAGANELTAQAVTCALAAIPAAITATGPQFFVTRQRGATGTVCNAGDAVGVNNIHGCGNFGLAEDPNCAPLNRQLSHTECAATAPWLCDDPLSMTDEALVVTKRGAAAGGVLCCH